MIGIFIVEMDPFVSPNEAAEFCCLKKLPSVARDMFRDQQTSRRARRIEAIGRRVGWQQIQRDSKAARRRLSANEKLAGEASPIARAAGY